ncbi:uncharacterized protein FOKN1_2478 [Thiohalobacter thiocyanaticus]|uniref:FecR protein domain-containing protein n=1 Tax=Thiohalobacter thiocyanaticus TaxID=585455 RepID=A0A1Z4VT84_9GAMM|nr:FecR domain-containing protein [Thiohalobacter thiocyanaticus]BAZ94850.1 uncharacterized protein FOKN1_2478 [Thiohalobacter thiocyanaticus]
MQAIARSTLALPGLLLGLCLLCGLTSVQAAPAPAGHVIIARGEVQAISAAGEARDLRRRSPFYAGETLMTGTDATAQLRFSDGALVALRPDTEFRVDRYRYEAGGGEGDESISTLIKGGFRTITGAVGKQDPDSYRVDTPVATIGVRGTHYEAVVGAGLAVAVWQGGVTLRNEGGALNLGQGANYSFATIASADRPPRGQLQPPPGLKAPADEFAPGGSDDPAGEEDGGEGEDQTAADTDATATDSGTADEDRQTSESTATTTGTGSEGDSATADSGDDTLVAPVSEADTLDAETSLDTTTDTTLSGTTTDTTLDTTFTVSEPVDTVSDITSQDARLSDTEWQQLYSGSHLGLILEANSATQGMRGGRAIADPAGSPVFTENGYAPFEPEYADAPIKEVFRRGGAALDALGSHTVDSNHTVYWGVWNGNPDPVIIQTDATDPDVIRTSNKPFFWATLQPTDPAVLDARSGVVSYNNVIAVQGGGSGGQITAADVTFTLDVNFDTGAVSNGNLQIGNGAEYWNIDLAGQIKGSFADLEIEPTSSVTVSPSNYGVLGEVVTGFTGNNGEVLGGGFLLEAQGDPGIHAEGILLVD